MIFTHAYHRIIRNSNTEILFDYSLNFVFVHKYVYSKEGCRRTIANKTVDKRKESKHKNNIEKKM